MNELKARFITGQVIGAEGGILAHNSTVKKANLTR